MKNDEAIVCILRGMEKISAVVITYNAEKKIPACLASLQGVVDEIVVMDNFSQDLTPTICKEFGVRFYQQNWKGYGQQKNDAAGYAKHDYVLSLDADEVLSPELQQSILNCKREGLSGVYSFNRLNFFYGHALRYGLTQPDRVIRLYNHRQVKWSLRRVHETLELDNSVFRHRLTGNLNHYSKDSLEEYISTLNHYSTLGAQVYAEAGKKTGFLKILFSPAFTFFKGYFFRLGILDGLPGLIMAFTLSLDTFLKYSKLYYLQRKKTKN